MNDTEVLLTVTTGYWIFFAVSGITMVVYISKLRRTANEIIRQLQFLQGQVAFLQRIVGPETVVRQAEEPSPV